jgi:hypothetical protein
LCTCREECNNYDLDCCCSVFLIDPYHNDWSRWFAISSPPNLVAVPVSVLWVGLQKSKELNSDVKQYFFAGSQIEHH